MDWAERRGSLREADHGPARNDILLHERGGRLGRERGSKFRLYIIDRLDLNVSALHSFQCVRQALQKIDPENKRSLHVSFDIDALDPLEAPATGTPGKHNPY